MMPMTDEVVEKVFKEKPPCTFEACGRKPVAFGLCSGHYQMQQRGQELRPLGPYKRYVAPAPGLKVCNGCERVLDAEKDFYKRVGGRPQSECKKCMIARQKRNNAARKEREKKNG